MLEKVDGLADQLGVDLIAQIGDGEVADGLDQSGSRVLRNGFHEENGQKGERNYSPDVVDVQESWVSPDLEIVVLAKHKSTARGSDDAMWEIQKLDRSEPDAVFFEIPTDYKIVTATFDGSQPDSPPW